VFQVGIEPFIRVEFRAVTWKVKSLDLITVLIQPFFYEKRSANEFCKAV
jgi:hypothetical protein